MAKKPIELPFTILVDDRERISGGQWTFQGMIGDSDEGYRPLVVQLEEARLETGDYSIRGLEHVLTIERKALSDIFNTCGQGRERFEAEHQRMAVMRAKCLAETAGGIQQSAWVVIEATWPMIARKQGVVSKLHPMSVIGACIHYKIRHGIPWETLPGRRAAEVWTFRTLKTFWEQWRHVAVANI